MTDLSEEVILLPDGDAAPRTESIDEATAPIEEGSTYCRTCSTHYAADVMRTESIHRSAEGLVGYLRCPENHLALHRFAPAYPNPEPPASVLALRANS